MFWKDDHYLICQNKGKSYLFILLSKLKRSIRVVVGSVSVLKESTNRRKKTTTWHFAQFCLKQPSEEMRVEEKLAFLHTLPPCEQKDCPVRHIKYRKKRKYKRKETNTLGIMGFSNISEQVFWREE